MDIKLKLYSWTLLIQKLLAHIFIGLAAKMIGKNRQKAAFATAKRRKLPLRACKNAKTGHFYPSKVPASQ